MAEQAHLFDAEEHVRRILLSRRMANASGQRGEDVENIRAAYSVRSSAAPPLSPAAEQE